MGNNICFRREIKKVIFELSSFPSLIWSVNSTDLDTESESVLLANSTIFSIGSKSTTCNKQVCSTYFIRALDENGTEDNLKIIFMTCQQKHMLCPLIRTVSV